MRTFWLLYKAEAKLSIREMSSIVFGIFVPLGIIIMMGFLNPDNATLNLNFASVATVGICAAGIMGLPLALSSYREKKILKRYQITPISPVQLLLAHLFFCFTISIISMLLVLLILTLFFNFTYTGSWLQFTLAYLLVMVAIHSIGLIVASLSPSEKATGAINSAIFFPMIFISGATVPYEIMPRGLQIVADTMPLTLGIKLLKAISVQAEFSSIIYNITILVFISIIGIFIAIKFFRWE